MEDTIYQRTEILIGKENVNKLKAKNILIARNRRCRIVCT